jgi:hypothetical protein
MHVLVRCRPTGPAAAAVAALLLLGMGCSPSGPSGNPTTETFTGTVSPQGLDSHPFTVSQRGDVIITLTAVDPLTSAYFGVGIGTQSGSNCTIGGVTSTIQLGTYTGGTEPAGNYCVAIFDVGYLSVDENYTLTVSHY